MTAKHPLVVIGDSLSQGFMSGAIHRTDLSYGAMLARALGAPFETPRFEGEGGLPLNLEDLLRAMSRHFGEKVSWYEVVPMVTATRSHMDRVEDYWERGRGTQPGPQRIHHNQAVWGFEVADAMVVTEGLCDRAMPKPKDNWFKQVPEDAMYRTARRTLNPSLNGPGRERSAFDNAAELGKEGVEHLIVALGANNALGTVLSLTVKPSQKFELFRPPHEREANLYLPEHFEELYRAMVPRVQAVNAANVYVATVPHVTIPPVTRGVTLSGDELSAKSANGRRYFEYYTRPWIWDDVFDPGKHPHLTRAEAMRIDEFIDGYNETIRAVAAEEGWHVVDLCGLLDKLATRSQPDKPPFPWPKGLIDALEGSERLGYLVKNGEVQLDTRFLHLAKRKPRYSEGGMFSIDGVHPTTLGYTLMANECLEVMKAAKTVGKRVDLPWKDIVASDTLANDPPAMLRNLRSCLANLEEHWGLSSVFESF